MTILSSSPAFSPSARRDKRATAKRAFQLKSLPKRDTEASQRAYEWCYHWFWYIDLLTEEWALVMSEASGNPSHWFHHVEGKELTERFLARVMTKAQIEQWVPF